MSFKNSYEFSNDFKDNVQKFYKIKLTMDLWILINVLDKMLNIIFEKNNALINIVFIHKKLLSMTMKISFLSNVQFPTLWVFTHVNYTASISIAASLSQLIYHAWTYC